MAKQGKRRTMSICLTDIPKDKILIHENGKKYLMLETWDNDEPDKYDNDFSVSVALSKDEDVRFSNHNPDDEKENGQPLNLVGNTVSDQSEQRSEKGEKKYDESREEIKQIQNIINANFEAMLELGYINVNGELKIPR